jgi:hypothetical protein
LVEADDHVLSIGGDRNAELTGQVENILRGGSVDRGIALGELGAFLTKELLRSGAPGSSRRSVDRDRHRHLLTGHA